jgi:hypothetical protein
MGRGVALDRLADVGAVETGQPTERKIEHRGVALGGQIAPEAACHIHDAERRARRVGEQRRRAGAVGFFEHHFVRSQPERIVGQFQRHMVVAAELELGGGVELAFRQIGVELDLAGRKHIGGDRHDGGAGRQHAPRGLDLDAAGAFPPGDAADRIGKLDRDAAGELGQERAESLAAQEVAVALGGMREIDRRDLGQILGAAERAQHELDHGAPAAEVLGQRLRAGKIGLARRIRDGGGGAHDSAQIVLHLAFARVAPPDAHALARWRRIDVEPGLGPELRHRIDLRHMDPVGPAIKRNAEHGRVGDAAAADRRGGFEECKAPADSRKAPRRRNAGRPGPHNDHIDAAGARSRSGFLGAGRRRPNRGRMRRRDRHGSRHVSRHGGRGGEERPAIQSLHGCGALFESQAGSSRLLNLNATHSSHASAPPGRASMAQIAHGAQTRAAA